jgi:hypothetical protein
MAMSTEVEPATGREPPLPAHWKEGVLAIDAQDRVTWIGKRVPPDQLGDLGTGIYRDAGDGWELCSDP